MHFKSIRPGSVSIPVPGILTTRSLRLAMCSLALVTWVTSIPARGATRLETDPVAILEKAQLQGTFEEALAFLEGATRGTMTPDTDWGSLVSPGAFIHPINKNLEDLSKNFSLSDRELEKLGSIVTRIYMACGKAASVSRPLGADDLVWVARTHAPEEAVESLEELMQYSRITLEFKRVTSFDDRSQDPNAYVKGSSGVEVLEILKSKEAQPEELLRAARVLVRVHSLFRDGYQNGRLTPLVQPRGIDGMDARSMDELITAMPESQRAQFIKESLYDLHLCFDGLSSSRQEKGGFYTPHRDMEVAETWLPILYSTFDHGLANNVAFEVMDHVDRGDREPTKKLPFWVIEDLIDIVPQEAFPGLVAKLVPIVRRLGNEKLAEVLEKYRKRGASTALTAELSRWVQAIADKPENDADWGRGDREAVPDWVTFYVGTRAPGAVDGKGEEGHFGITRSARYNGFQIDQFTNGSWRKAAMLLTDEEERTILEFRWTLWWRFKALFAE